MIELRPCPFCGGRAELNEHTGYGWRTVQCVECCASTSEAGVYTAAEAAARWNRRAADQPDAAIPCSSCGQPAAAHAVQNGGYVCPPNQPAAAPCGHIWVYSNSVCDWECTKCGRHGRATATCDHDFVAFQGRRGETLYRCDICDAPSKDGITADNSPGKPQTGD